MIPWYRRSLTIKINLAILACGVAGFFLQTKGWEFLIVTALANLGLRAKTQRKVGE